MLLTPWFITAWNYDSKHDLARATKICEKLFRTTASIKLFTLTYG